MENIPLKYSHKAAIDILYGIVYPLLYEHKLLQERLTGGSWMGFRDSENPLKVSKNLCVSTFF